MNEKNREDINNLFNMMSNYYMGQFKRKEFYNNDSAKRIYELVIEHIKKQEKTSADYEKCQELREVADNFYNLIRNPKLREEVIRKDMKISEFMELYREEVLGDDKRKYDMSDLFNETFIKSKNSVKGDNSRYLKYTPFHGETYEYTDEKGNEYYIVEVGRLYMQQWNGLQNYIDKYSITRKENEEQVTVDEIYSNISIRDMDDEKYRNAVIRELLSRRNIDLSQTKGYVGEIVETPINLKKEKPGKEINVGNSSYLYKINDKYSLLYDAAKLSAVMLQETTNSKMAHKDRVEMSKEKNYDDGGR